MKRILALTLTSALLVGCSNQSNEMQQGNRTPQNQQSGQSSNYVQITEYTSDKLTYSTLLESDFFSNRDYKTELNDENPTVITLADNNISVAGSGATDNGSYVTISEEGTYVVSGTLANGQIVVDMKDDTHKAQIVLDNVDITCKDSAGINVVNADKVFVTTAENSKNYITATISSDNTVDAGIFSKSDITVNGLGELTINVTNGDAIVGKDEVTITSGTYVLTSDGHGIDSNDGIAIAGGTFTINVEKDGLHSEHTTNESKGYVYILDGDFYINAGRDGIDASGFVEICDGTFDIKTNGGWESAPVKQATSNNQGGRGQTTTQTTTQTDDTPSTKGIKSAQEIRIYDGLFNIDAYDDAIHSDKYVEIHGGDFTIGTADDALHANWEMHITGGNINIVNSFEGIEAQRIYISGGYIDMYCGDDGINASSGDADPDDSSIILVITGGQIILDSNSEGDGVDSNGAILITGGEILVSSTIDQRDTALDSDQDSIITGGRFLATGSN